MFETNQVPSLFSLCFHRRCSSCDLSETLCDSFPLISKDLEVPDHPRGPLKRRQWVSSKKDENQQIGNRPFFPNELEHLVLGHTQMLIICLDNQLQLICNNLSRQSPARRNCYGRAFLQTKKPREVLQVPGFLPRRNRIDPPRRSHRRCHPLRWGRAFWCGGSVVMGWGLSFLENILWTRGCFLGCFGYSRYSFHQTGVVSVMIPVFHLTHGHVGAESKPLPFGPAALLRQVLLGISILLAAFAGGPVIFFAPSCAGHRFFLSVFWGSDGWWEDLTGEVAELYPKDVGYLYIQKNIFKKMRRYFLKDLKHLFFKKMWFFQMALLDFTWIVKDNIFWAMSPFVRRQDQAFLKLKATWTVTEPREGLRGWGLFGDGEGGDGKTWRPKRGRFWKKTMKTPKKPYIGLQNLSGKEFVFCKAPSITSNFLASGFLPFGRGGLPFHRVRWRRKAHQKETTDIGKL